MPCNYTGVHDINLCEHCLLCIMACLHISLSANQLVSTLITLQVMTPRTETSQVIGSQNVDSYLVGHCRVPNAPHEQGHKAQHSPEEVYHVLWTGPDPSAFGNASETQIKTLTSCLLAVVIAVVSKAACLCWWEVQHQLLYGAIA